MSDTIDQHIFLIIIIDREVEIFRLLQWYKTFLFSSTSIMMINLSYDDYIYNVPLIVQQVKLWHLSFFPIQIEHIYDWIGWERARNGERGTKKAIEQQDVASSVHQWTKSDRDNLHTFDYDWTDTRSLTNNGDNDDDDDEQSAQKKGKRKLY